MATPNKPELIVLETGSSLKILKVTALAGMIMPLHHATKETVIMVEEGSAVLKMPTAEHVLNKGASIIIPGMIDHSLEIKIDFKAIVIMALDS